MEERSGQIWRMCDHDTEDGARTADVLSLTWRFGQLVVYMYIFLFVTFLTCYIYLMHLEFTYLTTSD